MISSALSFLVVLLSQSSFTFGKTKILQTNDDGWAVSNIRALNTALRDASYNVSFVLNFSSSLTFFLHRLSCPPQQQINLAPGRPTAPRQQSAKVDASIIPVQLALLPLASTHLTVSDIVAQSIPLCNLQLTTIRNSNTQLRQLVSVCIICLS